MITKQNKYHNAFTYLRLVLRWNRSLKLHPRSTIEIDWWLPSFKCILSYALRLENCLQCNAVSFCHIYHKISGKYAVRRLSLLCLLTSSKFSVASSVHYRSSLRSFIPNYRSKQLYFSYIRNANWTSRLGFSMGTIWLWFVDLI